MRHLILVILCAFLMFQGLAQPENVVVSETVNQDVLATIDSTIQEKQFNKLIYTLQAGVVLDDSDISNKLRGDLTFITTYRISQLIQLGIGIEAYQISSFYVLPIYIQYQGNLSENLDKGLYYYGAIGKGFSKTVSNCDCNFYDTSLDQIIKMGLGYRFTLLKMPINVSAGWSQVKMRSRIEVEYFFFNRRLNSSYYPYNNYIMKQQLNSLEFKIGMTF